MIACIINYVILLVSFGRPVSALLKGWSHCLKCRLSAPGATPTWCLSSIVRKMIYSCRRNPRVIVSQLRDALRDGLRANRRRFPRISKHSEFAHVASENRNLECTEMYFFRFAYSFLCASFERNVTSDQDGLRQRWR